MVLLTKIYQVEEYRDTGCHHLLAMIKFWTTNISGKDKSNLWILYLS